MSRNIDKGYYWLCLSDSLSDAEQLDNYAAGGTLMYHTYMLIKTRHARNFSRAQTPVWFLVNQKRSNNNVIFWSSYDFNMKIYDILSQACKMSV
jgi:hypothetical protein